MSTRIKANQVAAAIRQNFAVPLAETGRRTTGDDSRQGMTRSTFSAPRAAIVELRTLALRFGVNMNDLLLLGVEDVLKAAGVPANVAVKPGLRDKLQEHANRPDSAAAASQVAQRKSGANHDT